MSEWLEDFGIGGLPGEPTLMEGLQAQRILAHIRT